MEENKLEKTIAGIELIKEFLGDGLPGQRQVFESYINILNDALQLLKEQEEQINELKERLRTLEYGDKDVAYGGLLPAT